jgi:hypothetical protein
VPEEPEQPEEEQPAQPEVAGQTAAGSAEAPPQQGAVRSRASVARCELQAELAARIDEGDEEDLLGEEGEETGDSKGKSGDEVLQPEEQDAEAAQVAAPEASADAASTQPPRAQPPRPAAAGVRPRLFVVGGAGGRAFELLDARVVAGYEAAAGAAVAAAGRFSAAAQPLHGAGEPGAQVLSFVGTLAPQPPALAPLALADATRPVPVACGGGLPALQRPHTVHVSVDAGGCAGACAPDTGAWPPPPALGLRLPQAAALAAPPGSALASALVLGACMLRSAGCAGSERRSQTPVVVVREVEELPALTPEQRAAAAAALARCAAEDAAEAQAEAAASKAALAGAAEGSSVLPGGVGYAAAAGGSYGSSPSEAEEVQAELAAVLAQLERQQQQEEEEQEPATGTAQEAACAAAELPPGGAKARACAAAAAAGVVEGERVRGEAEHATAEATALAAAAAAKQKVKR